jgi:hypothetical protein
VVSLDVVPVASTVDLGGPRGRELDGIAAPPPDDPDAVEALVAKRVADHVEPALLKAHDEMGDGRGAASIALRWLTPRVGHTSAG